MAVTFCCEACEQLNRNGCDCDKKIFQLLGRYWTLAFEDYRGEEGEIEYSKKKLDILVDIFAHYEKMEIESSGTVALVKTSKADVLGDIQERYWALSIEYNAILGDPLPNFFVRHRDPVVWGKFTNPAPVPHICNQCCGVAGLVRDKRALFGTFLGFYRGQSRLPPACTPQMRGFKSRLSPV